MKTIDIRRVGCVALAIGFAFAVPAQGMAQTPMADEATAIPATPDVDRAGFDKPVAAAKLASLRGGTEVVSSDMQLSGTTASNTATNVATGTNAISAGSFSNMSGLPIVIQNTGANVLIQNAVILNLQMN
jgi:hypothetical protein